jgi:hypothetical protein
MATASDLNIWQRLGESLAGLILIAVGLAAMAGQSSSFNTAVGKM